MDPNPPPEPFALRAIWIIIAVTFFTPMMFGILYLVFALVAQLSEAF